jgi:phosphoribosylcarboxyaminoimidazole (NCAIR) mutase
MQNLKQSELNWIREVVSAHNMTSSKLNTYAEQVQDPKIRQMFSAASTEARQAAQNLLQML